MDALIYTAMSGAERALRGQQVHANNLANMDTGGFRANLELATAQKAAGYGYDDRHMATMQANAISTKQGTLRPTGRDMDVAISGPGYFAVEGPTGEAYTRAGAITLDQDGTMTVNGMPILGEGGPITLPIHSKVEIGQDGTVSIQSPGGRGEMQVIDKLKLVRAEGSELTKNEAGLIVSRDGQPLMTDNTVTVRPGHLEGSNVSAVEEMVATMSLNRTFEVQMKLFKAADDMTQAGNRLVSGN
ncbi:flagellar basal body rod protein FlgF [Pseudoduganella albidiflava]|uniref:Flagellar basal-body rod protein FlgF n=1 Tax=Pseudoduganella albidiflava TaxID=321983 RepID=A0A411WWC7_9BURK|nr:flagellar basal body rod protein FlgF [Pseudoduganella albidiflava]QBI01060.1 flagellar basal body rod protein FlgF [Pseudoduganella albidiflava]GGY47782.1 flagellar basal body protein [Pseudoduganella albidiflava]